MLADATPLAGYLKVRAERIGAGEAVACIPFTAGALRPGGTYSGPALMTLIDVCMYAAVLGLIGDDPRPLTTNVTINFLRRPPRRDLIARCNLLSRGSDFVVGSVVVHPEGDASDLVCSSTCTYALPVVGKRRPDASSPAPTN